MPLGLFPRQGIASGRVVGWPDGRVVLPDGRGSYEREAGRATRARLFREEGEHGAGLLDQPVGGAFDYRDQPCHRRVEGRAGHRPVEPGPPERACAPPGPTTPTCPSS